MTVEIQETDALSPIAQDIVNILNSYTEISPSGKGIHAIVEGKVCENLQKSMSNLRIEIYRSRRYFTFTGNVLDGLNKVQNRQAELEQVINKYYSKPDG